jgi:hypothetical protein
MGNLSRKKRLSGAVVVLLALGVAGLVYAAWTTSGDGNGYAKAGSAVDLTTSSTAAAATLYPGVNGDVVVKINNPNPYPVRVTDVTGNGTITSDNATCGSSGHPTGVTFTDQHSQTIDVPAKSGGVDGTFTKTLAGAAHMGNSSDDSCQGAVFTIPVHLSGVSNAS